jgi:hypothetical protein
MVLSSVSGSSVRVAIRAALGEASAEIYSPEGFARLAANVPSGSLVLPR